MKTSLLANTLANSDLCQQSPQTVPTGQFVLPFRVPMKERVEDRLDDILGIDLATNPRVEVFAGQGDETADKLSPNPFSGVFIPRTKPRHHDNKRLFRRHGQLPSLPGRTRKG